MDTVAVTVYNLAGNIHSSAVIVHRFPEKMHSLAKKVSSLKILLIFALRRRRVGSSALDNVKVQKMFSQLRNAMVCLMFIC